MPVISPALWGQQLVTDGTVSPWFVVIVALVVGLVVGSFLNVVIFRLPAFMEWEWRTMAREVLGLPEDKTDLRPAPYHEGRSRCPHCHTPLAAKDNVPLLSYLSLRGKCRYCKGPISAQYPVVEAGTMVLFGTVIALLGLTPHALALLFALTCWWVLFWIDARTKLLPDGLVYASLWVGLLGSAFGVIGMLPLTSAVTGAAVGWGILWTVATVFARLTGRQGMGEGDFKLLAAIGAWTGPFGLLPVIGVATFTGLLFAIVSSFRGRESGSSIPFGPFLIAGAVATLAFPGFWQPWIHF